MKKTPYTGALLLIVSNPIILGLRTLKIQYHKEFYLFFELRGNLNRKQLHASIFYCINIFLMNYTSDSSILIKHLIPKHPIIL